MYNETNELSQEELQEYQELITREYARIERLKLYKPCKFCGATVTRLGYSVCSKCYKSIGRWCSTQGKPIDINHILALAEKLNTDFKPSKELVDKVKELRKKTSNSSGKDVNFSLEHQPLNFTEYSVALLLVLYFTQEREVIAGGPQFQSYVIYVLINRDYLRDSRKKRLKLYSTFEEEGLLQLMFKDYSRLIEHLDDKVLKRYYDGDKNASIFEDVI